MTPMQVMCPVSPSFLQSNPAQNHAKDSQSVAQRDASKELISFVQAGQQRLHSMDRTSDLANAGT